MATVPYGIISKPLDTFRTMLSYSQHYQAWCEETDPTLPATNPARAAATLAYISLVSYPKPDSGYVYPHAIVELPDDANFEAIAVSGNNDDFDTGSGAFDVVIVRAVPAAYKNDDAGAWLEFAGEDTDGTLHGLGAIIEDLRTLTSQGTYLMIREIRLVDGPWRLSDEKSAIQGHLMGAKLRITWGMS